MFIWEGKKKKIKELHWISKKEHFEYTLSWNIFDLSSHFELGDREAVSNLQHSHGHDTAPTVVFLQSQECQQG